jgi:hypothetical protein
MQIGYVRKEIQNFVREVSGNVSAWKTEKEIQG